MEEPQQPSRHQLEGPQLSPKKLGHSPLTTTTVGYNTSLDDLPLTTTRVITAAHWPQPTSPHDQHCDAPPGHFVWTVQLEEVAANQSN